MEAYTVKEIADAVCGELVGDNVVINDITTDSTKCAEKSCIFIAIKGERFDGNDFAQDWLEKADAVLTSKPVTVPQAKAAIIVNDTKKALRNFAKYHLNKYKVPVIAVTGSVGKTSTKDMIYSVLSKRFNVLKTQGNLNNDIGVPLTLFNLTAKHQMAVLEMGMNNFGEIRLLSGIAPPDVAVITNITTAHIGRLGSTDNILRAKLELLENLSQSGILIANADDEKLFALKGTLSHNIRYYGIENNDADIVAYNIELDENKSIFTVDIDKKPVIFQINEPGKHLIYNALAAIAAGVYYKIEPSDITEGIASYTMGALRQHTSIIGNITIIEDCYNASAASMRAALNVLALKGKGKRTIAVLGDVLEQGDFSEKEHRQIGDWVADYAVDKLITVGADAKYIAAQASARGVADITTFENNSQVADYLFSQTKQHDVILFKASRGMRLEEISENLIILLSSTS